MPHSRAGRQSLLTHTHNLATVVDEDQEDQAPLTSPTIMSHLPFVLPEQSSNMDPPPPVLEVSNPTDAAIGDEEKTTPEHEPRRTRPAQGEEESSSTGQHTKNPPTFLSPSGEGPYLPMQDGMHPSFQPGNPPPSTHPPPSAEYPEHAQPRYPGDALGAAGYDDSRGNMEESSDLEESDDEDSGHKAPADTSSNSRARVYVKWKTPAQQKVLDWRAKKNESARKRSAKLRARIEDIQNKPDSERTEEERELLDSYQDRRQRKNDRSRERAIEKKTEIECILAKPEKKRSAIESSFLESALYAQQRKNLGDRTRRQRIKQQKIAAPNPSGAAYEAFQRSTKEPTELKDSYVEDSGKNVPADTDSASRVRVHDDEHHEYKIPSEQELLDRRARKNANERIRACKAKGTHRGHRKQA